MLKAQKGQTLIETALILFLLLLILLGISEFARAWYTKNSLKNAVRSGARLAVVTPSLDSYLTGANCDSPPTNFEDCPNANAIANAVCTSPGVKNDSTTKVCVAVEEQPPVDLTLVDSGDTITVAATSTFTYIVGGSPWPWPTSTNLTTDASMRYE